MIVGIRRDLVASSLSLSVSMPQAIRRALPRAANRLSKRNASCGGTYIPPPPPRQYRRGPAGKRESSAARLGVWVVGRPCVSSNVQLQRTGKPCRQGLIRDCQEA